MIESSLSTIFGLWKKASVGNNPEAASLLPQSRFEYFVPGHHTLSPEINSSHSTGLGESASCEIKPEHSSHNLGF